MSPDEPSPPRIPAASDGHVSPAPRRGKGAFLWAVAALLTAAAVFGIFARCVPLNMDEFVSYQTLVALHFPHSVENVFCSTNASFYLRVLNRVTLPLLLPGLLSGAVLAFARSLGEFGATLTFAGSRQGVTRTLPLEIYLQRVTDANAAVALSILLVVVAALVVLGLGTRRLAGTDAGRS